MRVFQLITPQRPDVTARLVRQSGRAGATPILDLEDGLWDPLDEARTPALKSAGRSRLRQMAERHGARLRAQPVGARINHVASPEAQLDVALLAGPLRALDVSTLVVPKVESGADLQVCADLIRQAGLMEMELVPIVETRRGFTNLDGICRTAAAAGTRWIVFGHFDFALDAGWWPFPGYFDAPYREVAGAFIEQAESAGLRYFQAPYSSLNGGPVFTAILDHLGRCCAREFGILTVSARQSALAYGWRAGSDAPGPAGGEEAVEAVHAIDAAEGARRLVEAYEAGRRPDVSFAIDARAGEFIPPHLYLLARHYLAGLQQ
jgi:citrate lyase beta subunit